jgi:hypothetical protein
VGISPVQSSPGLPKDLYDASLRDLQEQSRCTLLVHMIISEGHNRAILKYSARGSCGASPRTCQGARQRERTLAGDAGIRRSWGDV